MLIVLPPSETKRDGGTGAPLDVSVLSYPRLTSTRRHVVRAIRELSRDVEASRRAFKLSAKQDAEIERNRQITRSGTMSAIDRYTGVLYDALDAGKLDDAVRAFAAKHLVIHSAAFGLVSALDPIPAYRLSHDSRLPGEALRSLWADRVHRELVSVGGLIVDLRSEAYAKLGPIPKRPDAVYVRVVTTDGTGRRRALNHFNKQGKGEFTRAILLAETDFVTSDELIDWAGSAGFQIERAEGAGGSSEVQLVL